jgi:hypothetical protein
MLKRLPDFHITLLGKDISPSTSARDLGIIFDENMSYDEHVTKTVSTCMAGL